MMRRLFISSTLIFWFAVGGFWKASLIFSPTAAEVAVVGIEQQWSFADVARHDTAEDCWMVINGQMYDFSAYVPQHPSSPAVFTAWCGKEASEAYRTKTKGRPHSAYADTLLPKYRIGVLR